MNNSRVSFLKLRKYFDSRLDEMNDEKRLHFCERMFKLIGEERYRSESLVLMENKKNEIDNLIKVHNDGKVGEYGKFLLSNFVVRKNSDLLKLNEYEVNPELLYYFLLIWNLYNYWMITGNVVGIKKSLIDKMLKLFLDKGVVRNVTSRVVNSVYALKYLYGVDSLGSLSKLFNDEFMVDDLDSSLFENKMYGLTHFIINESIFYSRFVGDLKESEWIKEMEIEFDKVVELENMDLLVELGLCFLLVGTRDNRVVIEVKRKLMNVLLRSKYVEREGYSDLNDLEHRNVLAIMFLYIQDKGVNSFFTYEK